MKNNIINLLALIIGNATLAIGVTFFVSPTNLIMGGGTGIAFSLNHFTGIDISLAVLIINITMFILGVICMGKKFAALTIVSTVIYPLFLEVFGLIFSHYNPQFDIMISSIFGGVFIGAGIGLVLRQGASTGGMDIPPIILNKYLKIPTPVLVYCFDFVIILSQAFSISLQDLCYSMMLLFISSVTMSKVMILGSRQLQVLIISPEYEKINQWILGHISRGTTFVEITTGFKEEKQKAVLCVLSKQQLHALNKGILNIDSTAFTIISEVNEVHGRGFSLPQIQL